MADADAEEQRPAKPRSPHQQLGLNFEPLEPIQAALEARQLARALAPEPGNLLLQLGDSPAKSIKLGLAVSPRGERLGGLGLHDLLRAHARTQGFPKIHGPVSATARYGWAGRDGHRMNACTIITKSHVAYARVLAASLLRHHPEGSLTALVVDDPEGRIDPAAERFAVLSPEDVGVEEFEQMASIYDATELACALKPWLLRHMLRDGLRDRALYLDADIKVFSALHRVEAALGAHPVVMTPHITRPLPDDGHRPSDADFLTSGAYNLGFLGVDAGPEADALLDWWAARLRRDCVFDPERGRSRDQSWMDLAPPLVPGLELLRDPGLNLAYWNLPGRALERSGEGYTVDADPLGFFHFSGFDPERPHLLSRFQDRISLGDDPVLFGLCSDYADEVLASGHREALAWGYGYEAMADGTKLDRRLRRLYRRGLEEGALQLPLYGEAGTREFVAWLNEPAEEGADHGVTRFLYDFYLDRPDLRRGYGDLDRGGARFLEWCREYGSESVPIPEPLLPAATSSRPLAVAGAGLPSGVNVAGYLRAELGIGEMARNLIAALDTQRVPVAPVSFTAPLSRQGHDFGHLRPNGAPFPVNLICVNADGVPAFSREAGDAFFAGRYSVGLWWWEVSLFPDSYREAFDYLDEVWVGSHHVAEAVGRASPVPVVKITPPVRVPSFPARTRPELGLPEGFLFLFVFDYRSVFRRKNPLALIEAFTAAFPPGSGASLAIKCINQEAEPENHERLKVAAAAHPDVHVVDRYVSAEEKNAMIAACDCYVSLHRSEGFGITLAEAMYLGRPVIGTAYSGNLDYMTPHNSYLVDFQMATVGEGAYPYPPEGEWAEPDTQQAAQLMRHVFENPDEARERGARGAADIRRSHSLEAAGERMAERLARIEAGSRQASAGTAVRWLPEVDAAGLAERIGAEPPVAGNGELGGFGRAARGVRMRLASLLLRPYLVRQRELDRQLAGALAGLDRGLREVASRLDALGSLGDADAYAELRRQTATAHADVLAELRRQGERLDRAIGADGKE
jgi:glycosyltransferase involved in cell wall biosynthesis